jgi:cysteine desulfurase family protein (TIGR01976 family)
VGDVVDGAGAADEASARGLVDLRHAPRAVPGLQHDWARLDAPAGTQAVDSAIEAIGAFMASGDSANAHGSFAAAHATDALVSRARATVAELFGGDPRGVVFGPSMTSLTLAFSAAVGRTLRPGDEIVLTRLDHDANVAPWLIAAERAGATVRFAEPPDRASLALPAAAVEEHLTERTRWVAVTAASNAVGTIPDLPGIVAAAHAVGARVYVDAVHHAPHRRISVRDLGCDVLACSPYKWFGPHAGLLVARDPELLAELDPDKLRPSPDTVPERWETGTPAFEVIAGIAAAARYLLELDWEAVRAHEEGLLARMLDGLRAIPRRDDPRGRARPHGHRHVHPRRPRRIGDRRAPQRAPRRGLGRQLLRPGDLAPARPRACGRRSRRDRPLQRGLGGRPPARGRRRAGRRAGARARFRRGLILPDPAAGPRSRRARPWGSA